jgi:hypothetical protein
MRTSAAKSLRHGTWVLASLLALAGCQSKPLISSQTAPQADLTKYHTYAFMEKLSTDRARYTSITTQLLKEAASRELAARGLVPGENPDLLVNFVATSKDKVEGRSNPRVGVSYGRWGGWRGGGWGVGVGGGDGDIRSVQEDTITVDLVDKARNELVWSGSAAFKPTEKEKNDSKKRIDAAVAGIFGRFPVAAK